MKKSSKITRLLHHKNLFEKYFKIAPARIRPPWPNWGPTWGYKKIQKINPLLPEVLGTT
jgi:hypothetical protein